jgi:hypothetical protein
MLLENIMSLERGHQSSSHQREVCSPNTIHYLAAHVVPSMSKHWPESSTLRAFAISWIQDRVHSNHHWCWRLARRGQGR